MRVIIAGFYGMGNRGDEAILEGFVKEIRKINPDIGIDAATELPFIYHGEYNKWRSRAIPLYRNEIHYDVGVRTLTNYDFGEGKERVGLIILGGGGLAIGYGYGLVLRAMNEGIPIVNMGIEYKDDWHRTSDLFHEFLKRFSDIAVRSRDSSDFLTSLGIDHCLTFCPSLQVNPIPCGPLPDDYVVVTPRRTNDPDDKTQVCMIVNKLKELDKPAVLLPFSKYDLAQQPIDMKICDDIHLQYPDSTILPIDGYTPGAYKFIISKASLLVNSGRFHASIFAAEAGIPAIHSYPIESSGKIYNFLSEFGIEKLDPWSNGFGPIINFGSPENKIVMDRFRELERMNSTILRKYIPIS